MPAGHKFAYAISVTAVGLFVGGVALNLSQDPKEGVDYHPTAPAPKPDHPDFALPLYIHAGSRICANLDEIKAMVDRAPANCTSAPGTVRVYETNMQLLGLMGSDEAAIAFRAASKDGGAIEAYALMSDIDNDPD